jgi:hypothetical protein
MKYLILSILILSILSTNAQKNISYDLFFDAGTSFSKSPTVVIPGFRAMQYDPNTGTTTTVQFASKTSNTFKNKISPQVSFGVRANYTLTQYLKIYGGLGLSFLNAKRINTFPITVGGKNFDYITTESFNFYNLDFKLGLSASKNKWSLNVGISPSLILNSKVAVIEKPENPEFYPASPGTLNPQDPQPSADNKERAFISISISPLYQVSNKLKIGLEYDHGLSKLYSSEIYQSMKVSSLCFKILYKLK